MSSLNNSVVAILDANDHICGTGFLAAERLIVTCAHVVTTAQKAGSVLKGRFHLDGTDQELTIAVDGWFPEQDVAILACTADPPSLAQPLPLGSSIDCAGHDFITLGYPHLGDYVGIPARGTIDGQAPKTNGQVMLMLSH